MGWQQTYRSPWKRQQEINLAINQLIQGDWLDHRRSTDTAYHHQRRARWLVNRMVELGPTFIKLGHFLTSRIDLLPLDYIQALHTLPGWLAPVDIDTVLSTIEAEFGASPFLLYRTLDPSPIAADPIGQVHRATLPNGTAVAVKIQRPELEQLLTLDLSILGKMLPAVKRHFDNHIPCDLERIFEEFAQRTMQQIDWIQTAVNADRMRHNFRDTPAIWVPQIYPSYTTRRILTMEYAPGIMITDRLRLEAGGFELGTTQQLAVYCYLKQILQDGFFQTNLNPCRFAISSNNRLVLYGFSEVDELSPLKRSQLIQSLFELQRQDGAAAIRSLVNGGLLLPNVAPILMRQIMQAILQYLHQDSLDRQSFNQLQEDVYSLFRQQPFCLPSQTLWMLQGLGCLDELVQSVDSTYNLVQASQSLMVSPSVFQRLLQGVDSLGSSLIRPTN